MAWPRGDLGQVERGEEEAMGGQLDPAHLAFGAKRSNAQLALADGIAVKRVEAVITSKLLGGLAGSIGALRQCPRQEGDFLDGADQRADQFADHQLGSAGCGLFVIGVLDAQDIAGILYQSMLEAPSGADEGAVLFPCELDSI